MATINKFTSVINPDCVDTHITPSKHTVVSITTTVGSENKVGTSVEVPSTLPRVQNDTPEPLNEEKEHAQIIPKSSRQVNLLQLSSLVSKFDQGCDSDDERGPWYDVIGLKGEQDYEEDEIPKIQVEVVIKDKDVNVYC